MSVPYGRRSTRAAHVLERSADELAWLACDAHRQSLSDFLGARGFLKDVVPHARAD